MAVIEYLENSFRDGCASVAAFSRTDTADVRRLHAQLSAEPTRLALLPALARKMGLRCVAVKDESGRFGLNAFKGLGGAWAVFRTLCRTLDLDPEKTTLADLRREPLASRVQTQVFITATDGNHGKGVAWAAGLLGCHACVLMPRGTVEARARAVREAGKAECHILNLDYDDCVFYAAQLAQERGWQLVQDTSWPGYEDVPFEIMRGYTTLVWEALDQMKAAGCGRPTHVLLQAGVGSMAGAVTAALAAELGDAMPRVEIVEPFQAACIGASMQAADGEIHPAAGMGPTVMAGLNCGTPCDLAWTYIRTFAYGTLLCGDETAERGMRLLGRPLPEDPRLVSGESGAVTAGVLDALCSKPELAALREKLGLGPESVVLLISTEGATDPDHYRRVLES